MKLIKFLFKNSELGVKNYIEHAHSVKSLNLKTKLQFLIFFFDFLKIETIY